MKLIKLLLRIQSSYIFITAAWPIIDIKSFIAVTGPKNDLWLVKTVAALLISVSVTLGSFLFIKTDLRPAIILGASTSAAFIIVDFYYAISNVISDIYMADGLLETVFLLGWIIIIRKYKNP